jgi:putative tricarboxylic transport membrane protein
MPRNLHQTGPAIALLTMGVVAVTASFWIPLDYDGSMGARIFPLMSAGVLILLGGLMLRPVKVDHETEVSQASIPTGPLMLLAVAVLYLWLIGKLGYLISTGFVTPVALWLFGIRRPAGLVVGALAAPVIFHLIFFEALGVFPPYGAWFDLLNLNGG